MRTRLLLAALAGTAMLSPSVYSQATTRPATQPSAPPVVSRELSSGAVQFRALPAVLDARERRQDWHQAADQAEARISNPHLRDQLNQRLSGLVPKVVDQLRSHPQDEAIVTLAVYQDPNKTHDQAMLTVTFNGLASQVGPSFIRDVVNNLTTLPQADGVPNNVVLDSQATSYLVFFFGNRSLEAGDVTQAQMTRSITVAANQARDNQLAQQRHATAAEMSRERQVQQEQQRDNDPQQAAAPQPALNNFNYGGYPGFPPVNDGYYYPDEGVPIVILPNEYPDGVRWRQGQRRREQQLEQHYRQSQQKQQSAKQPAFPPPPARRGASNGGGAAAPTEHK